MDVVTLLGVVVALISPIVAVKYNKVRKKLGELSVVLKEVKDVLDLLPEDVKDLDEAKMREVIKELYEVKNVIEVLV